MSTKDVKWYKIYKVYLDKINHLIRKSKNNNYKKYFIEFKQNSKKIWNGINELISQKKLKKNSRHKLV